MEERELGTDLEGLVWMLRQYRLRGYTVHEAAAVLGISTRTVFRWLKEGKLKGEKCKLATNIGYFWLIDQMSVAKILVRKEVLAEIQETKNRKVEQLWERRYKRLKDKVKRETSLTEDKEISLTEDDDKKDKNR